MENLIIKSNYDDYELHVLTSFVENHKGIILMFHGMEEYKERYIPFIKKLNEANYSCVISDMRGHGRHLDKTDLGYFTKHHPEKALVCDEETILQYFEESYPTSNFYLFAHSMGTIISRNFLQHHSNSFKKVVLSGPPVYNNATPIAVFLANVICLFKPKKKAKFLKKITVSPFSKAVKNPNTKLDWLSINKENIQQYWEDPYCGFGFKNNAFLAMLRLINKMDKKIDNKNIIPPIMIISGSGDPVPGGTNGLNKIIKRLKKAGYKEIINIVIDNARHELINEDNKDVSINKIIEFYNN